MVEKNQDKLNWRNLSLNPNAIHILEKNLDKVNWDSLWGNPNIFIDENMKKNSISLLFKKFESLLKEYKSTYCITEYIYKNKLFGDETFINEPYDGIIYSIPYEEWLLVTGIDKNQIQYLQSLIPRYEGYIYIDGEGKNMSVEITGES